MRLVLTACVFTGCCLAQMPQAAQVDLYFPHLAVGGPAGAQWQMRLTFINPNNAAATVWVYPYSDSGAPLSLDFGQGPTSQASFTIPANGTTVLQTNGSNTTVTGWAYVPTSLPILANAAFRLIQNGSAKAEITAEPTLPSTGYRAVATPQVGVAVANVYPDGPTPVTLTVIGSQGHTLGQTSLTLPPLGHSSFNLWQVPGVPASFTGSVLITPQNPGDLLLAWAVYADSSGVISSLPDGRAGFPGAQPDKINNAFYRVVSTYQNNLSDFGSAPQLTISAENDANAINAFAIGGTTVQINLAVSELISDSDSELAFVIAHELGHIYQQRTGKFVWYADKEWDADCWGLVMSLLSGYDPYAGAGALGKLAMASATAGLQAQLMQTWEQMSGVDAHGSFATRIDNLTTFVEQMCSYSSSTQSICNQYKKIVHPDFPALPSVPLIKAKTPDSLSEAIARARESLTSPDDSHPKFSHRPERNQ